MDSATIAPVSDLPQTLHSPGPESAPLSAAPAAAANPRAARKATALSAMRLIVPMIEAFKWGQTHKGCELVGQIERAVTHEYPDIARKLSRLAIKPLTPIQAQPTDLVVITPPRFGLESVVLPPSVERNIRAVIQEMDRAAELAAFNLPPRNKILIHGPTGTGKTMLGEALAKEMSLTLVKVRQGGLVDSHLGGTAKNLDRVFSFAAAAPCLVSLDEFDGLATDRRSNERSDVGEIQRVTNQLLLCLDQLPSTCVLVAMTNLFETLDPAIVRRFDAVIELPAPTEQLALVCAERELSQEVTPGFNVQHLATEIAQFHFQSFSDIVKMCARIRRDLVFNKGENIPQIMADARPKPPSPKMAQ